MMCLDVAEVSKEFDDLTLILYFEEAVILLTIIACIGMIIRTKQMYSRIIISRKAFKRFTDTTYTFDYLRSVREGSLLTVIGITTLLISLANYVASAIYIYNYVSYIEALERNHIQKTDCEVASAWVILTYCSLFEVLPGTLCFLIICISCHCKVCYAAWFLCPVCHTSIKKRLKGYPQQFDHYS